MHHNLGEFRVDEVEEGSIHTAEQMAFERPYDAYMGWHALKFM